MSLRNWQTKIFVLLWVTYASFYLGRVNFSVALPGIMADFGWTRAQLGMVGAALFWAYALGQFINGQLGDKVGARIMVAVGLVMSAFFNAVFTCGSLGIMLVLWATNGYFQACGWGPVVKTLANWFPSSVRGKMSGWLGTSYILGSAISVALAGFIAARFGWQMTFFVPAVLMVFFAIHWYAQVRNSPADAGFSDARPDTRLGSSSTLKLSVGNPQIWLMGFGLFFTNILRYGFLTWAPTYLFEVQHASIDKAAYSSVLFPVAGAMGAVFAGYASDKWFQSRRAPMASLCLALAGILAWAYRFAVPVDQWILGLATLASTGFAVFGAHVLIVAGAPADLGTRKAASSATGFIDCLGYIGAGMQGIATGLLVDRFGWSAGFAFWVASALIGACLVAVMWKFKVKEVR